ncbi:hypothetical protein [Burkholderia lata]|uniref:hypothetical protein n=1 Tax=Burkholderia lata (strain ATCC 17760 / DSM 23089 / LMG 22485 / NCIMB 9086 / R18194 / 383) TaxID=482957 RepID=UPI0020C5C384|nr:hypothetical protein [Burkholderia lata]
MASIIEAPLRSRRAERGAGKPAAATGGFAPPDRPSPTGDTGCAHNHFDARAQTAALRFRRCGHAASTHRQHAPESTILKMPTDRVLARLRILHDDFSIYQGYRRYADIVAGRASNAQDARIFAI